MKLPYRAVISLLAVGCRPTSVGPVPPTAEPMHAAPPTIAAPNDRAAPKAPDDLSWVLEPIVAEHGVPGLGAAVVNRDGLVAIGVAGVQRVGRPNPLSTDDRFHLGSDTKAMTAYLAGRLVDEGTLAWKDELSSLFPAATDWMHPDFRAVTLDQLLAHRGGLPANIDQDAVALDGHTTAAEQRAVVSRHALGQPPRHSAGSFVYSNLGYIVLGTALQERTGASWEALIRREVFEPLQMRTCGFGPVSTDANPEGSWAHALDSETYQPTEIDNPAYLGPAGTVHCSLEDWGRFARAMFEHAPGLDPATRAHLATPAGDDSAYARGWMVSNAFPLGEMVLTHDGSNTVNYASVVVAPRRGLALMTVCNAGGPAAQAASVQAMVALMREYGRPANPSDPHPLH